MEVKNPLFKEDFGQSTTNLHTSESIASMPPSYSTINTAEAPATKVDTLVQIVEPTSTADDKPASENNK